MIYVSTGGYSNYTAPEAIAYLNSTDIFNIELSGGKYFNTESPSFHQLIESNRLLVHNYFPVPYAPFVLNLAASNSVQLEKSINHVINSIKLASTLGSKYYSVHAGFLLDISVSELGKSIAHKTVIPKDQALDIFLRSVNILSDVAHSYSVELLIENNVLSAQNYSKFMDDIFIFSSADDAIYIMNHTPSNVNLLVDVGHLKVSSTSLRFSTSEFLSKLDNWILAYHLSDNDGISDQNKPFTSDSWFWPYIKPSLDYYSIEVYTLSRKLLSAQVDLAHQMITL